MKSAPTIEFAPGATATTVPVLLVGRRDAARMLGIGLTKFGKLVAAGDVRPVRLLRNTEPLYRVDDLTAFVERVTESQ